eukprot:Sro2234_g320140.2  (388) ;mRNA; f:4145-5308
MLAECAAILNDLVKAQDQTIFLSEAVGYFQLDEDEVVCVSEGPSSVPSQTWAPSQIPSIYPSYVYSDAPSYVYSSSPSGGGSFSCYDDLAEGEVKNDDCYAVDIGICKEDFGGGCVETYATYEYYNSVHPGGNPRDVYGYVNIATTVNCPGQEDFCSASVCSACEVSGDTVALLDCTFLSPADQTVSLAEGGGYATLENDEEKCNAVFDSSIVPSTAPSIVSTSSSSFSIMSRGSDAFTTRDFNGIVMTLKPHLTFHFFPGHQEDEPPEASQILILLERIESYFRDVLAEDHALMNIQFDDIQKEYQVHPKHQFELSFVAKITFDAAEESASTLKTRVVTDMLADDLNLREFVGRRARFVDEDRTIRNGLLYYTSNVRARISGSVIA